MEISSNYKNYTDGSKNEVHGTTHIKISFCFLKIYKKIKTISLFSLYLQ